MLGGGVARCGWICWGSPSFLGLKKFLAASDCHWVKSHCEECNQQYKLSISCFSLYLSILEVKREHHQLGTWIGSSWYVWYAVRIRVATVLSSFSAVSLIVWPCKTPFLNSQREDVYSKTSWMMVEAHEVEDYPSQHISFVLSMPGDEDVSLDHRAIGAIWLWDGS
jgi:hypothetical protein